MSSISQAVGGRIRRCRQAAGISPSELARRSHLSKATLSQLESGKGNPTLDTLHAVAVGLQVTLTELLRVHLAGDSIRQAASSEASAEQRAVRKEIVRRTNDGATLEIWTLAVPPQTKLLGIVHSQDPIEHLLITAETRDDGQLQQIF